MQSELHGRPGVRPNLLASKSIKPFHLSRYGTTYTKTRWTLPWGNLHYSFWAMSCFFIWKRKRVKRTLFYSQRRFRPLSLLQQEPESNYFCCTTVRNKKRLLCCKNNPRYVLTKQLFIGASNCKKGGFLLVCVFNTFVNLLNCASFHTGLHREI